MQNQIKEIPKIQQKPRAANETAIHYGYVAFKDIDLSGPLGVEHHVQPDGSPYYRLLPCRELIPFTNVVYTEIDERAAATTSYAPTALPVVQRQKSSRECAEEMVSSYEEWGFVMLSPLTGFSEEDAFQIFQTIQPFTYKLVDLLDQVEYGAIDRINETAPYSVNYNNQTFTMQPLSADLKEVALAVRDVMIRSIEVAVEMGADTREKTVQSMTQYFSTGAGKRRADPLDQYIFDQFNEEVPRLLNTKNENKDNSAGILEKLADAIMGRQKSEELEKELAEVKKLKEELKSAISEPATIEGEARTVSIGDKVVVGGQEAVVTAKPFGRVKIQFADGSARTVAKDEIG